MTLSLLDLIFARNGRLLHMQTAPRELDIPILMVTARTQDVDKIRGLGFGADDYIEKAVLSPAYLSRA